MFLPRVCQIPQVTQGANCPIRSFLPVAWFLSDWHFPFPDPGFGLRPPLFVPLVLVTTRIGLALLLGTHLSLLGSYLSYTHGRD